MIELCFTILVTWFKPYGSPGWFIHELKDTPVYTWQVDGYRVRYLVIGHNPPGGIKFWDKDGQCKLGDKNYPIYKRTTLNMEKK